MRMRKVKKNKRNEKKRIEKEHEIKFGMTSNPLRHALLGVPL